MAASKSQKTRIKPSKPLTQYFTTLPPPSQPRKNSTKPITGSQSQSKPKDALPVKAATPAMHCSPKPTPPKPDTEYINISSDSSSASDKSVIVITSGSETSPPPNSVRTSKATRPVLAERRTNRSSNPPIDLTTPPRTFLTQRAISRSMSAARPSPKSSKRSAAKGRVPTPMSIPSTDDEKPIIVEHVVISRHSSRISLSRNNSPHEGLGFAGQSPARRDTRSASSVPKHSPSAPFDPNQPYSGNSPASDARRNSLLSKRSASDSPPPCPLPTKKMKLSPSPSREPVYIFGDEIVPSSEGEEEVDLQPMARRCISAIHNDAMDGVVMNSSQTMPAQTGPEDDDENHISDTVTEARRLSFTNTITSEMEVSSQLRLAPDPSEIHMSSHPSPRDENADLSDAESFDSEKARINALNVKIEVEDADEPFDDSFLAEPLGVEVSPPRPAKTARSTNSEDDVEPKTPRRSSKPTSRLQLAMRSLITSSPLTDSSGLPYSEDLEATTNASSPMARHSPSPVKLPEDEVIVELPRLTRSQRRTYQSFIVPESKTTVAPTKGASNQPASRTSKQPRLQKSAGSLALDALLNEKRTSEKRAKVSAPAPRESFEFMTPTEDGVLSNALESSPVLATFGTAPGLSEPPDEFVGLLDRPEILKSILKDDIKEANDMHNGNMEPPQVVHHFWEDDQAMDVNPTAPIVFTLPDIDSETPLLKSLQQSAFAGDVCHIATLLQSKAISLDTIPDELIDHLLDLAVLHPHSLLREAALSCLQDLLSSGADAVKDIELDFSTICRLLGGLGALDECLHLVAPEDKIEISAFRQRIPSAERDDRLVGLLKLVTLFAQLQQIYLADVPKIVLVLLLMSQDPRCTPEHKVDIANAIQWLFRNLGRSKKRAVQMEQTICCAISDIIEEWGIKDSLDLIRAIPRCEERGTRITRWVAFGKLAGSVFVDKRTEAQYVLTPPLSAVVSIVFGIADKDGKVPPASAHFAIEDHTDYDHLTSYMDLVGFILTDIDTYTKQDKGLETLDAIVEGLGLMTSRIIDKAGAKLERTRAKGEIQRLKIRLTYQSSTRSGPTTLERRSGKKVVRQASLTGFFTSKT